ncbi:MAG: pyridoxamine 5'-phosphate oxidase family protein [Alphaproteobacteria bacterium]
MTIQSFADIAFTPSVKALQANAGSRESYARMEGGGNDLGPREWAFLAERDSFYMASVSETGWPYVQHRGGPAGFLKVVDGNRIGFADFTGNKQYVSTGNLMNDDRVSLILVDYPNRQRLKLLGHARLIEGDEPIVLDKLGLPDYRARVERGVLIDIAAFDWNCPQHITPRYTAAEIEAIATANTE